MKFALVLVALLAVACASAPPPKAPPEKQPAPALPPRPTAVLDDVIAAPGATGAEDSVRMLVHRGGKEVSLAVRKGRIGVTLIPIRKGVGRAPLPPGTVKSFDFSRLADRPQEAWFAFYTGEEKCGYGRIRALLVGDRLLVLTEEVFEDGTQLLDHEVTCVTTATGTPTLRMTAFRDRMNDWERFGSACAGGKDEVRWTGVSLGPCSDEEA